MTAITSHDLQDMHSYLQSWLNELQLTKLILSATEDGYIAYGTANAKQPLKPAVQLIATKHPTHGINIVCQAGYVVEQPQQRWYPITDPMPSSTGHIIPSKQNWVSEFRLCSTTQNLPNAPHPDTMIALHEWVASNLYADQHQAAA